MPNSEWRRALLEAEAWRVKFDQLSVSKERTREFARWSANPLNMLAWEERARQAEERAKSIK